MTHARLRRISAFVGWALFLTAVVFGQLLHWDFVAWLLLGSAMLAIQWSHGFGRRESSLGQKAPEPAEKILR
ncbi:MAG TPA: hypothetical protein VFX61_17475 [Micromonosporaceae bacterium]|nr:hypothetical protein [Micromonosporaceae bacterium]